MLTRAIPVAAAAGLQRGGENEEAGEGVFVVPACRSRAHLRSISVTNLLLNSLYLAARPGVFTDIGGCHATGLPHCAARPLIA